MYLSDSSGAVLARHDHVSSQRISSNEHLGSTCDANYLALLLHHGLILLVLLKGTPANRTHWEHTNCVCRTSRATVTSSLRLRTRSVLERRISPRFDSANDALARSLHSALLPYGSYIVHCGSTPSYLVWRVARRRSAGPLHNQWLKQPTWRRS